MAGSFPMAPTALLRAGQWAHVDSGETRVKAGCTHQPAAGRPTSERAKDGWGLRTLGRSKGTTLFKQRPRLSLVKMESHGYKKED